MRPPAPQAHNNGAVGRFVVKLIIAALARRPVTQYRVSGNTNGIDQRRAETSSI